eukprot:TRINITY_DN1095_c0_g1_i1.p1 TRINITY_DN1095_c0_g1~~TRINITY_DN1095_c0_g1_i1.p1  ORF type:complete len:335 (-),score=73.43 TRINITY_DN1095_c0_g1_i1:147-1151(-)
MEESSIIASLKSLSPQPTIKNEFEAIALVLHATMLNLGFRLSQVHDTNVPPDSQDNILPEGWNSDPFAFSFTYRHTQSAMTFVIKSIAMGDVLLIHGRGLEDSKIHTLQVTPATYVNTPNLANTRSTTTTTTPSDSSPPSINFDTLFKDLGGLISLFKINITSKLLPMLNKPGYEETVRGDSTTTQAPRNTDPLRDPRNPDPLRDPRDFDPLREPPRHFPPMYPQVPVGGPPGYFGVGGNDRFPPFPGMGPGPRFPGEGGNLVGPNHPGFGGIRPYDPYDGRRGIPSVPPGARFDPFGPPQGQMNRPPPPPRRPFPGEPDNDELSPPGYDNMFM